MALSAAAAMHPFSLPLTFSHGPVILPYYLIINIIPGIDDQSDTVNDLILFIGHCDLHFMVH